MELLTLYQGFPFKSDGTEDSQLAKNRWNGYLLEKLLERIIEDAALAVTQTAAVKSSQVVLQDFANIPLDIVLLDKLADPSVVPTELLKVWTSLSVKSVLVEAFVTVVE